MVSKEQADWHHVDPAYKTHLRIHATLKLLVALAVILAGNYTAELVRPLLGYLLAGFMVLFWFFWVLGWIPRRYNLTQYLLADDCVHFKTGALWRLETSVTHNRLQHLELEHGPLERALGICRIVLYTAGGQGADLTLPGMNQDKAQAIKSQLLDEIEREQLTDEAITQAPGTAGEGNSGEEASEGEKNHESDSGGAPKV